MLYKEVSRNELTDTLMSGTVFWRSVMTCTDDDTCQTFSQLTVTFKHLSCVMLVSCVEEMDVKCLQ